MSMQETQKTAVESNKADTLILKPSKGLQLVNLKDLWAYRELAYFLTWRDIKVRYKQTILGAAWAILQPLLQMIVFNFIFGNIAQIGTDGIPRPVFTYAALLPWNMFAKALGDAGRSLVTNRNMITKVYFPRVLIPISTVLGGVVDFAIAFVILIGMMFAYQLVPTLAVLTLPFFLLLAIATALGVGFWLSALNVLYRDVRYILQFLTQFWMLATPVAYPLSEIPERFQLLYSINPMVGVVEGFRWALLGQGSAPGTEILISAVVSLVLLISGLLYFRWMERTFADRV